MPTGQEHHTCSLFKADLAGGFIFQSDFPRTDHQYFLRIKIHSVDEISVCAFEHAYLML